MVSVMEKPKPTDANSAEQERLSLRMRELLESATVEERRAQVE